MKTIYVAIDVMKIKDQEYGSIHIILVGGRIPMMAQWRPCDGSVRGNGVGKWFSMGMSQAKELPKGVTHFLLPLEVSEGLGQDDIEEMIHHSFRCGTNGMEEYVTEATQRIYSAHSAILHERDERIKELENVLVDNDIFVCDRCGEFYNSASAALVTQFDSTQGNNCRSCQENKSQED